MKSSDDVVEKQIEREQNGLGWAIQAESIAQHVLGGATVQVEHRIARSAAEVFDAIVDPAQLSRYFVAASSGRIEPGAKLDWQLALTDEGVARALQQTQLWTAFCCGLGAHLLHGIDLRAAGRRRPGDVA